MENVDSELLFRWAKKMGIRIVYTTLRQDCLGRANAAKKLIKLELSLKDNPRQLKCVLAEEIGHILFPPRPGHVSYHAKDFYEKENCSMIKHTVAQDERLARDWATSVLLGHVDWSRIKSVGAKSVSELADYFDVEPWFMEHRIGYLRRKPGKQAIELNGGK